MACKPIMATKSLLFYLFAALRSFYGVGTDMAVCFILQGQGHQTLFAIFMLIENYSI